MKILVTGDQGFIGKHLVKKLEERGHEVVGLDIVNNQDITDPKHVGEAMSGCDYCFHLAGLLGTHELVDNTAKAAEVNIIGTINVLDACVLNNTKLIEISKPNVWINTYSITKEASEKFTEMYRIEHGLKAAVVKWFNVYGTGQPLFEEIGYKKAVPTWIVDGLQGIDIEIYGNGKQTMDLIHTEDTVDATIAIMDNFEKCEGEIFEVGAEEVETNKVAEMIRDLTGGVSEIRHVPMRKGEVSNTKLRADLSKIEEYTGWTPKVPLEEGMKECVDWYEKKYVKTNKG